MAHRRDLATSAVCHHIFSMLPFELAKALFHDPKVGEKVLTQGLDFSELLPSSELALVDEAGHMVPYEQTEAVAEAIRKFPGAA